ncbi:aliphatic sulfonate ABC transporter (permease) [Frankia canadensis]|uniref:Aliphatic sulfonate ABC transporter (Permease) n=1 Tax=Frankia canadensis TaxID=1836972 RepID=A0A2I2KWQ9_9ACTN|nr:ABC transporter permease [Frankia canadensis]SNQ50088.1 aliphatic sulfonate ABC transporter (permease) [Frankia canadensis]SOU57378.1 aliphatic sulfonate ABC transporter (permease) [Frankia canadensis]
MTTITAIAPDEKAAAKAPLNRALIDLSPNGRGRVVAMRQRIRFWGGWTLRVGVPMLLIVFWQLALNWHWTSEDTLPSPKTIVEAYKYLWGNGSLQDAIPVSLRRAGEGLLLGGSAGLVIGIFAGLWKLGEEIFDATLQMLRTVPFIALVPLFVTWFGIEEPSKLALITAAALFPLYLNTFHAVKGVDQKLIEAGKTFGLTGFQIARRIIFPTALPGILTGLRFACSFSLLSLVLAEQVNATAGIGYLIINAQNNQRPDIVIAGIWIYAVLGILIDFFMRGVERLALPWRARVGIG